MSREQNQAIALERQENLMKSINRVTVKQVQSQKDAVYRERDHLVSLVSKSYPSWLERHPDDDLTWEDEWRWIVFVELPTGQASWHIHESELEWFDHLERRSTNSWDGHTNEEKYQRVQSVGGTLTLTPTEKVLLEVHAERVRQTERWGEQNHDHGRWQNILAEEVGEAAKEVVEADDALDHLDTSAFIERIRNLRKALVQVSAVAVQIIESLDRNELSQQ